MSCPLSLISLFVIATPFTSNAQMLSVELNSAIEVRLTLDSETGKSYEIQSRSDLSSGVWQPISTLSANASSLVFKQSIDFESKPNHFYRVRKIEASNGTLVDGQTLTINQTWEQEPGGFDRTAAVRVPSGDGPFPVVIMLHGNGGNSNFINSMGGRLDDIIRIAPNGYLKSWNIDREASKTPDVAFIRDLINLIKTYDNVDAGNLSLYGSSNGSGMVNRLLIELDGAAFQKAAGRVSQMISKMYQNETFRFNASGTNGYNQVIVPASGRKILNIGAQNDPVIPYEGGSGVGTTFHSAQESIFRFAQAMGEKGPQLADAEGIPGNGTNRPADIIKYSYLDGDVVHYKVISESHGLAPYSSQANDLIAAFILNQKTG